MFFYVPADGGIAFFFFFSSRRRHTRLQGDWSSDVCSSDLPGAPAYVPWDRMPVARAREVIHQALGVLVLAHPYLNLAPGTVRALVDEGLDGLETVHPKLLPSQRRELTQLA